MEASQLETPTDQERPRTPPKSEDESLEQFKEARLSQSKVNPRRGEPSERGTIGNSSTLERDDPVNQMENQLALYDPIYEDG
jgi:hypothetical protein